MNNVTLYTATGRWIGFGQKMAKSFFDDNMNLKGFELVRNIDFDVANFYAKHDRLPKDILELRMFVNETYYKDPERYLFERVRGSGKKVLLMVPSDIIYQFMHQNEIGQRAYLLEHKEGIFIQTLDVRIVNHLEARNSKEIIEFFNPKEFKIF